MPSRLSILGNAKEEFRRSTRRKSKRSPNRCNFNGTVPSQIVTGRAKKAPQPGGLYSWEAWRQQGWKRARKKIDCRAALRYCPKSRIDALVGQNMSLEPITPSGRIVEEQLDKQLDLVQKDFNSDGLAFVGPLLAGADDSIREAVEFIHDQHKVKTGQKRP